MFSSGQFLLSPTKKAAKDPTLNKQSSSESWAAVWCTSPSLDNHNLVQRVCWLTFHRYILVLLFPGLYLYQDLMWHQATICWNSTFNSSRCLCIGLGSVKHHALRLTAMQVIGGDAQNLLIQLQTCSAGGAALIFKQMILHSNLLSYIHTWNHQLLHCTGQPSRLPLHFFLHYFSAAPSMSLTTPSLWIRERSCRRH